MTNEDIIESVISILAVDRNMNQKKMQFFNDLCKRLEVSKEAVAVALKKAREGKGRVYLPRHDADKKRLLYFLVQAMVVDGEVGPAEHQIMEAVVDKLGMSRADMERFIQLQLEDIAASSFSPVSAKPQMTCPKCGHAQPVAHECRRCGIIFEKYQKTKEPSDADKLKEMLSSANIFKKN